LTAGAQEWGEQAGYKPYRESFFHGSQCAISILGLGHYNPRLLKEPRPHV